MWRCLRCRAVSTKATWRAVPDGWTGIQEWSGPWCVLCGGKAVQEVKIVGTSLSLAPEKITGLCYDCDIGWASTALAHCASCHESFSTDRAFFRHRKAFKCLSPLRCGLVYYEARKWWRRPGQRP